MLITKQRINTIIESLGRVVEPLGYVDSDGGIRDLSEFIDSVNTFLGTEAIEEGEDDWRSVSTIRKFCEFYHKELAEEFERL